MRCTRQIRCVLSIVAIAALFNLLAAAQADAQSFTLTVRTGGSTSGAVLIEPIGGTCRVSVCTFQVGAGTSIRLSAGSEVPGLFSAGTGPASACGLSTCRFTMNGAADVTATFSKDNGPIATVTTTLTGDGKGWVELDGRRCQNVDLAQTSVCGVSYLRGSEIGLDAAAAVGGRFTRFSSASGGAEACGFSAQCRFTLTADANVTVTFSALLQLAVTPPSVTGPVGRSQIFIARGAYSDGVTETVAPAVGPWLRKTPLPAARISLAATAAGGKVYAIGGMEFDAFFSLKPVSSVMAYDPVSDVWEPRAAMTTPRAGLGAVTVAGLIYAIGGNALPAGSVATVERYDPATNSWSPCAPLSTPRSGMGLGVVNGIIYAIGGYNVDGGVGTPVGMVEAYDPVTDRWTPRAPMPTPRGSAVVGVVGGILYAAGGFAEDILATVEAYDPASNTWTARASMPTGIANAGGAGSGDALYVTGATPGGVPRGLTYQYDPARDSWSSKSEMLQPRGLLGVAALDGIIYGIGGAVFPGASPGYFNNVEALVDRVLWSSSAPSVVTVNELGLATAVRAGTATITASVGNLTSGVNSATFTVPPQPSDLVLDAPANGSAVPSPFSVRGWAINRSASSGTGVDAVHVYAFPSGGGSPIFLGPAGYGSVRPDVGALFGAQFTNCGFTFEAATLAPGGYTLVAYAHNAITGAFDKSRSAIITVVASDPNGLMNIDSPTPGAIVTSAFEVGGWAIDRGAPSGTGVDAVLFYVFPNDGAGPGVFIGTGSYGAARPDVGAVYGSRFTNSGYHFTITGLGPGNFLLGVYAHRTVTNTFSIVKTLHFTVNANALMSIDTPTAESTIATPTFNVAGWAIDRAIEGTPTPGTGVDALHVYASPNPGSGQAPIFLGVATLGFARSDVAALYGSRYTNSGYNLSVNAAAAGLTPGVYSIVVHAHSAASGAFNNSAVMRVTIP